MFSVEFSESVNIYTDGACSGNPGPGGWGAVIRANGQEVEISGRDPATTNNRMELQAAIEALRVATEIHGPGAKFSMHTDSQYVQKGISEWIRGWKRNGWRTAGGDVVKNADLWQKLDGLVTDCNVQWLWVRGHSGHPENERADALARAAINHRTTGQGAARNKVIDMDGGKECSQARIDAALDSVLRASGSALKNYSMQQTLDRMREAMRKVMVDSYIAGSNDNFAAMEKGGLIRQAEASPEAAVSMRRSSP